MPRGWANVCAHCSRTIILQLRSISTSVIHKYFLSHSSKNCNSLATLKSWMGVNSSIKFIHVNFASERCITDQRWEHFTYTGSYLVLATSSWRFLKGKRRYSSSRRCCNSMHELTHHQVHGKPLSHIDTAIIQAFCSRETLKMYQRNATTALKPIFPAHNQGNAHMCLESTGSQSFILTTLK